MVLNTLNEFRRRPPSLSTRIRAASPPGKPTSSHRQIDDVARGVSADVRAARDEDLGAMDRPHYLATAGVHAVLHQEPIEVDAFVAQRIALVDTDHHLRQAFDVF